MTRVFLLHTVLFYFSAECECMQPLFSCDRNRTQILCLPEALLQEATLRQRPTCCAHRSAVRHLQAARSGSWDFEVHLASANVRGKSTESSKKRESKRGREKLPQRPRHAHTQSSCVGLFKRAFLAYTHLFSGLDTPALLSALRSSELRDPPGLDSCTQVLNKKH